METNEKTRIKADENNIELCGTQSELLALFTSVLRKLYEKEIMNDELLEKSIYLAKLTDEEIEEQTKELVREQLQQLKEISEVLGCNAN